MDTKFGLLPVEWRAMRLMTMVSFAGVTIFVAAGIALSPADPSEPPDGAPDVAAPRTPGGAPETETVPETGNSAPSLAAGAADAAGAAEVVDESSVPQAADGEAGGSESPAGGAPAGSGSPDSGSQDGTPVGPPPSSSGSTLTQTVSVTILPGPIYVIDGSFEATFLPDGAWKATAVVLDSTGTPEVSANWSVSLEIGGESYSPASERCLFGPCRELKGGQVGGITEATWLFPSPPDDGETVTVMLLP